MRNVSSHQQDAAAKAAKKIKEAYGSADDGACVPGIHQTLVCLGILEVFLNDLDSAGNLFPQTDRLVFQGLYALL